MTVTRSDLTYELAEVLVDRIVSGEFSFDDEADRSRVLALDGLAEGIRRAIEQEEGIYVDLSVVDLIPLLSDIAVWQAAMDIAFVNGGVSDLGEATVQGFCEKLLIHLG